MRIIKVNCPKENLEKFTIATVSQAIGRSEGSISGYFSNRNISTKNGITIDQIEEVLSYPLRGKVIDWNGVRRIRELLEQRGYMIDLSDEEQED